MKIKMIVMDLDRTLLTEDKRITGYTLSILEQCRKKGIRTVIATARSEDTTGEYSAALEPDGVIFNSGALVKAGGQAVGRYMLSAETSDGIIRECLNNIHVGEITAETVNHFYVTYKETAHADYFRGEFYDFTKPLSQEMYKITVEIENDGTAEMIAGKFPECNVTGYSGEKWYRFAHRKAEKMEGIKILADHWGIDISQIASFGDDYNDIGMLRGCGIGIAMENGNTQVKAAADFICGHHDDDGVARWIEEYILGITGTEG